MFPEGAINGVLRSAENRQKVEDSRAGIERSVMSFDEKTYKTGNKLFTREQQ